MECTHLHQQKKRSPSSPLKTTCQLPAVRDHDPIGPVLWQFPQQEHGKKTWPTRNEYTIIYKPSLTIIHKNPMCLNFLGLPEVSRSSSRPHFRFWSRSLVIWPLWRWQRAWKNAGESSIVAAISSYFYQVHFSGCFSGWTWAVQRSIHFDSIWEFVSVNFQFQWILTPSKIALPIPWLTRLFTRYPW